MSHRPPIYICYNYLDAISKHDERVAGTVCDAGEAGGEGVIVAFAWADSGSKIGIQELLKKKDDGFSSRSSVDI